jgi:predicted peroxiredoxin
MMKTLAVLMLAMVAAVAGPANAEEKKLVTIVGTAEPQTQLMSMVLSMQALKQGASVYILLCGPGGDLALKDAPESATAPQKPKGMSPKGLMQKIIGAGGTVEVCAIYLPNKGLGADALIDGVGAAKPDEMAARLLADDTRIMSF